MEAEHESEIESIKDTPYLTLTGELWYAFWDTFYEKWPRFNGTAMCLDNSVSFDILRVVSATVPPSRLSNSRAI